jgi:hypothetical protein
VKQLFALIGFLSLACGAPDADHPLPTTAGGSSSGGAASDGGGAADGPNPLGRSRCKPPAGTTGSPQTIEQAVALLNALPKPTSVACFVESLDRPLTIFSTSSPFSAQPALSTKSPRVFIKSGQLWLSIVIDGDSSELIEFGYLLGDTLRSIKGELHLPLDAPIAPSAPYERVRYQSGTVCGLCHSDERPEEVPGIAGVFSTVAFRPRPDSHVQLGALALEWQACKWEQEPHRCEMLSSVFGGGQVVEGAFPNAMGTFF